MKPIPPVPNLARSRPRFCRLPWFDLLADETPGPQGPPGEVTTAQHDAAVASTANNPAGIGPFAGSFSNPPTQAEMEVFAAWVETLRTALVR